MNVRTILSVAAITAALAFSGFAVAQEEHTIGGKAVPADQIEAVEARCQELRSLATEAPASDNDEATSEPAGDVAPPTPDGDDAVPAPAADVAGDNDDDATGDVWAGNIFSIADLTVDQCNANPVNRWL